MMLYEKKFDKMAAYICADPRRTDIVKVLERKGQSVTTKYFEDKIWYDNDKEVLSILKGLEKQGIIECLSRTNRQCESWDLTAEGRDVLIAIEEPVSPEGGGISGLLHKMRNALSGKSDGSPGASKARDAGKAGKKEGN